MKSTQPSVPPGAFLLPITGPVRANERISEMNALVDHKAFASPADAAATSASTAVSLFDFKGHQIRVVEIDAEPWFVAVDLYSILYGVTTGLSWVAGTLDGTERRVINRLRVADTLKSLFPTKGRGDLALISESGLYKLILRSDKPEAKPFQDWVTKVVLPSIRKDGGYIVGEEKVRTGEYDTIKEIAPSLREL